MHPLNLPEKLSRALRLVWRDRRLCFDMALVPTIWSLLLSVLVQPMLVEPDMAKALEDPTIATALSPLAFFLLTLVPWAMFATAWLRYSLGQPPGGGAPAGLSWTAREMRVLGGSLRLMLVMFAAFLLTMLVLRLVGSAQVLNMPTAVSIGVVAMFCIGPALARLSLILPAAAVDEPARLVDAWRLAKGNALRLFALMAMIAIAGLIVRLMIAAVLEQILRGLFGAPLTIGPRIVLGLAFVVMSYAASAVLLSALAFCYRDLAGRRPPLVAVPGAGPGS